MVVLDTSVSLHVWEAHNKEARAFAWKMRCAHKHACIPILPGVLHMHVQAYNHVHACVQVAISCLYATPHTGVMIKIRKVASTRRSQVATNLYICNKCIQIVGWLCVWFCHCHNHGIGFAHTYLVSTLKIIRFKLIMHMIDGYSQSWQVITTYH